jgi:hypothetical protein
MNIETYEKNKKPPGKHLMRKDGYHIRNGWLRFSAGISEKAFHDSNNKCVYYQLVDFLLNPKTGRPTKFLDIGVKMNEENLYQYFYHTYSSYNEDDTITEFYNDTGVSTEMIRRLCLKIKRNMYAYDADDKIFDTITHFKNYHYTPIVFYKMH